MTGNLSTGEENEHFRRLGKNRARRGDHNIKHMGKHIR